MKLTEGKLLSTEQSVAFALTDENERERVIAMYVADLRKRHAPYYALKQAAQMANKRRAAKRLARDEAAANSMARWMGAVSAAMKTP